MGSVITVMISNCRSENMMEEEQQMIRYHKFGQTVLYKQMMSQHIYKFLNKIAKMNPNLITWRRYQGRSVPFVKDGMEQPLITLLLASIPEDKKYVERYMFLD
jgi:hypothetical protein